jgi:hypothetical protein
MAEAQNILSQKSGHHAELAFRLPPVNLYKAKLAREPAFDFS